MFGMSDVRFLWIRFTL